MKDPLADTARRRRDRAERGKGEGPTFLQSLAYVGALGWLVTLPIVLGILAGRALDHGQGAFWTSKLLALGVVVGCWLAWRRVKAS